MSQRNKIQRLLRKGALATCLSLSVVCSSLSAVTAYAGPADDPAAAAPVIGPGGPGTTTDNAATRTRMRDSRRIIPIIIRRYLIRLSIRWTSIPIARWQTIFRRWRAVIREQ